MQVEMVVGRGEVRDEVIDYVTNVKADMLVVGTRELGALKRYHVNPCTQRLSPQLGRTFVGSTSDYCIHHCHCPVLVVKRPTAASRD